MTSEVGLSMRRGEADLRNRAVELPFCAAIAERGVLVLIGRAGRLWYDRTGFMAVPGLCSGDPNAPVVLLVLAMLPPLRGLAALQLGKGTYLKTFVVARINPLK